MIPPNSKIMMITTAKTMMTMRMTKTMSMSMSAGVIQNDEGLNIVLVDLFQSMTSIGSARNACNTNANNAVLLVVLNATFEFA